MNLGVEGGAITIEQGFPMQLLWTYNFITTMFSVTQCFVAHENTQGHQIFFV